MAVGFFAVARNGQTRWSDGEVTRALARARPDNLAGRSPECRHQDGVIVAIDGVGRYARCAASALVLGPVEENDSRWAACGGPIPQFASALFRANSETAEIASDAAASRTIWYVFGDQDLIASTSQRVLVTLLRGFELNEGVVPWVFASGGLGPGLSWDRRIRCLPPGATLRLDHRKWSMAIDVRPATWTPARGLSDEKHIDHLQGALDEAFAALPIHDDVMLPLSGGYDSRGILLFLLRHRRANALRTITWGTRAALQDSASDAFLARELSRTLGVDHRYIVLDESSPPFAETFGRFLAVGEGRLDHISGYTDGFAMWKRLHDDGTSALLRGDMGFGYPSAWTEQDVRMQTGIPLLSDYRNLSSLPGLSGMPMPRPAYLSRKHGESCTWWNIRLGHAFRLPTNLASLTQLKTPFVEIINPLLARPLLESSRQLPEHLLIRKRAFKAIVERLSPPVPFARSVAVSAPVTVQGSPAARAFLRDLLENRGPKHLPPELVTALVAKLDAGPKAPTLRLRARIVAKAKALLPKWAASAVRTGVPLSIPSSTLGFRAGIITGMCDLLGEDAKVLEVAR